jgi:hypothetical protein
MNTMSEDLRRVAKDLARRYASQRRRVSMRCAACGKEVEGIATRVYCSRACRAAAYRRRQRQQSVANTVAAPAILEQMAAMRERLARAAGDAAADVRRAREERTEDVLRAGAPQ